MVVYNKRDNRIFWKTNEIILTLTLTYILDTVKVFSNHRDYQVNSITKEYYIQLPKFREEKRDMNNKLNQWLALIDDTNKGEIEMAKEKNKIIKDAP